MPIEVGSAVVFSDGLRGIVRYMFSGDKGPMALIRMGNQRMRVARVAEIKLTCPRCNRPGCEGSPETCVDG